MSSIAFAVILGGYSQHQIKYAIVSHQEKEGKKKYLLSLLTSSPSSSFSSSSSSSFSFSTVSIIVVGSVNWMI